jgi:hypothetical protein
LEFGNATTSSVHAVFVAVLSTFEGVLPFFEGLWKMVEVEKIYVCDAAG